MNSLIMLEKLCRLCGKENPEMLKIFNDIYSERKLNFKIKEVIRLDIMEEDHLPNLVCLLCVEHLEKAFYFINHCHQTQIYLTELYQKKNHNYNKENINESSTVEKLQSTIPNESFHRKDIKNFDSIKMNPNLETVKNYKSSGNITDKFQNESTSKYEEIGTWGNTETSAANIAFSDESKTNDAPQTIPHKTDRSRLKRKCSLDTIPIIDDLQIITENKDLVSFDDLSDDEKNDSDDTFDMSNDCEDSDFEFSSRARKNPKKTKLPKQNSKKSPSSTTTAKSRSTKKVLNDLKTTSKEGDSPRKEKEKKRFSCATCKTSFTQELTYQEHLNVHTGNRPFSCKLCEASFRKRQELNQHLRTIHSEKQFKCPLCEHVAKHKGKLTEHMKSVHEKPFVCDLCNYRTGEKGKIMQHIANKHTGDLSYVCEICGNGFKTKTSLQTHRQNIHFPEPKVCQTCGTVCPSLARYSAHIFRCGKEKKRYPCEKCGKTYVNKEILKDHMNKHLNIRPYKCDVCGKEFFQRNRLDTHKYVHRGAAYRCEICNQSFNRKDNMKNHMKKHFYKSMRYDNMIVTAV